MEENEELETSGNGGSGIGGGIVGLFETIGKTMLEHPVVAGVVTVSFGVATIANFWGIKKLCDKTREIKLSSTTINNYSVSSDELKKIKELDDNKKKEAK